MELYYDLHIHSALSPCGDNEMTPNDIVGMAMVCGLNAIAVADHNSCKNLPAVKKVIENSDCGILLLFGMELCTSEEIHVLCYFDSLEKAMAFDDYVNAKLPDFPNNPAKFGNQLILNESDEIIGEESKLLLLGADISFMEIPHLMKQFDGVAVPAHIDRSSYSVVSVLGSIPEIDNFNAVEISDLSKKNQLIQDYSLKGKMIISNSDAHRLSAINEASLSLPAEIRSAKQVIELFRKSAKT